MLLSISAIIYLYSLDTKSKQSIGLFSIKKLHQNKNIQPNISKPSLIVKTKAKGAEPHQKNTKIDITTNKNNNWKTQTNVFNKLNYDLYYNELGEQFNIQGVNETVNGYDKSIYLL
jgi:hypothetical protein